MSTDDITETIPEEEEHQEEAHVRFEEKMSENGDVKTESGDDNSDDGKSGKRQSLEELNLPEAPLLDKAALSAENPIFREVTVSGGEWS